jgi:hypothetical protein
LQDWIFILKTSDDLRKIKRASGSWVDQGVGLAAGELVGWGVRLLGYSVFILVLGASWITGSV